MLGSLEDDRGGLEVDTEDSPADICSGFQNYDALPTRRGIATASAAHSTAPGTDMLPGRLFGGGGRSQGRSAAWRANVEAIGEITTSMTSIVQ